MDNILKLAAVMDGGDIPAAAEDSIALLFAERHAHGLRHVAAWGWWLSYDSPRWVHDETLHAFDLARAMPILASEFWGVLNPGKTSWTPEMDKLSNDGLLFTNLHASGNRTVRGMEGVLASFPPLPGEFTGPYLALRFRFYYNPDKADLE